MESYTTILNSASFEYEDRKSIFIAEAKPVSKEREAIEFISEIKKKYSDANHHVYAYVLRENSAMRFSDDREPQGTAGMPTLDAIRKNGCTDVVITVIRYFGGTLLGTGGLVRAYSAAATGALKAGKIITYDIYTQYALELSYSDYQKIIPYLDISSFRRTQIDYSDFVIITGSIKKELAKKFEAGILEFTGGRVKLKNNGERFEF